MRTVVVRKEVLLIAVILTFSPTVVYFARIPWTVLCKELFIDLLYECNRCLTVEAMKLLNPCTIPYLLLCLYGFFCLYVLRKSQIPHLVYRAIQSSLRSNDKGITKRGLRNIYNTYVRFKRLVFIIGLISSILLLLELLLPLYVLKIYRNIVRVSVSSDGNALAIIGRVVNYVEVSLNNSYNKPEAVFELDNCLSWLDNIILSLEGFERAHTILYQGWGSCGQYAIVVEYLLREMNFNTRIARFKKIDHSWAEVEVDRVWYIVDPWYIGKYSKFEYAPLLTPAYELASLYPFKNGGGVLVKYHNGTIVDESKEHGY